MCINCCKIYFCLICITHTELYTPKFIKSNLQKLKNMIKLNCKFKFLIINPIFGFNMNNFNNIINYYSKSYWMENPKITNIKPYFTIIRSYDLTSKYTNLDTIHGGIVGGYVKNGFISNLTNIHIRPGYISNDSNKIIPIKCNINNIQSHNSSINYCLPKGINGLELSIDPYFTQNNKLRGQILGPIETLPPVYTKLGFKFNGLKKIFINSVNQKEVVMKPLALNENIILSINSIFISGNVIQIGCNDFFLIKLDSPKCFDISNNAIVFRKINHTWMVSGFASNFIGNKLTNTDNNIDKIYSKDSVLFLFNKISKYKFINNTPLYIYKNVKKLNISIKEFNNKVKLLLNLNHKLTIPQYSSFKLKSNQLEESLKLLNILYTKEKDLIVLNIKYENFKKNYLPKILQVFTCSKCINETFLFYKKNSLYIQICSTCGNYLLK